MRLETESLIVEEDTIYGTAIVSGITLRAGITLDAFERLVERASFDPERDPADMTVSEIMVLLRPVIEAHLQTKYDRLGASGDIIVIEEADLTTH